MEKLVIVPTFNEVENIDPLLERLLTLPYGLEVLVVDDGSPDGTAGHVKAWQQKSPRVHLIERPGKMAYLRSTSGCICSSASRYRASPRSQ